MLSMVIVFQPPLSKSKIESKLWMFQLSIIFDGDNKKERYETQIPEGNELRNPTKYLRDLP